MAEVILINCPISFNTPKPSGDETSEPPLGIMYIASYLEKYGISVKIFDPSAQRISLVTLLKIIVEESPLIVGLSALTSSLQSAIQLANAIKERKDLGITIGIGGPHVNVDPDFIDRFPIFDFEVVGDGEKTMLKIVEKIKNGDRVSEIYFGEQIKNLDELPFPSRHQLDVRHYHPHEPCAVMIASRGCPFNCSFCSIPGFNRKVRCRSAKNIVDEMEKIYDDYNGNYSFMDDCFTLNRDRILDFCNEIISRRLKVRWMAMTRADMVDDELIRELARSGCIELFFGVESGNERIRRQIIHKTITDRQIFDAIKLSQKYGIQASIFLMLGFPNETKKEIEDTVNFGLRSKADTMGIHLTVPLPGSELFELAKEEGLIDKDIIDKYAKRELGDGFRDIWPAYIPKGSSMKKLITAKKRAYRKFYLNPLWILRRLWRDLRSPIKMRQDLRLIGTGIYTLIYGGTKTSMS